MQHDPFASLRIKEFQYFITGRFFFVSGLRMMSTIVAWWIYEVTHDPLAIGLIGLAEVIPAVGLALYAGHVIDHTERTFIMNRSVLFYSLVIFLIFIISTPLIQNHLPSKAWIFLIYVLISATGAIRAFSGATFPALLAQIVPMNAMTNAITLNNGTFLTAAIVGHAGGGLLIALMGIKGSLFTSFLFVAVACLALFRIKAKPLPEFPMDIGTWESVKEGLKFVYKTKELLASMTLDLFAVLFGGAVAMVPAYAKDILHVGPTGFGWLNAAADIGAMITVIVLTLRPLKQKQGTILLYAVAGFGISIIVFGLSKLYLLSFIALMLSGFLDGFSAIIRGTIAQLKTPNEIKGRVMSVNSMFINSSNEFGQFESGLAAKLMGLVASVVFGGSMTLLVVFITWWKAPKLRKLEY
jgi:MFS family permease